MILRRLLSLALTAFALIAAPLGSTMAADDAPPLAGVYRVEGRDEAGKAYRGMAAITQSGAQYRFKWWVDDQIMTGSGGMKDGQLVVDWGDKLPVIYDLRPGGVLDGTWAAGKATERLKLYAGGTTAPLQVRLGSYAVEGTERDGITHYKGGATITRVDDTYVIEWSIGAAPNGGEGVIEGNILIVKWDHQQPVIYAAGPGGSLMGLWTNGVGDETLTPVP